MSVVPKLIVNSQCELGEAPLWHPTEKKLYWVDIVAGQILRYDPRTCSYEQIYQGGVIGGFTIQSDGALLLFMAEGAIQTWHDGELTPVAQPTSDHLGFRFNDAIADPKGRVFSGTLAMKPRVPRHQLNSRYPMLFKKLRRLIAPKRAAEAREGSLYRIEHNRRLIRLMGGLGCPNGMGFSPDRMRMYLTDSFKRVIYLFDYDEATGAIANRRIFKHTPENEGVPDGLTVDAAGFVWSARWNGSCLVRYAPDGSEDLRVPFPAKKITSVTFGGVDYTDMYVTTAGGTNRGKEGPGAGAIFHLNLGIKGIPEFASRIALPTQPPSPGD